jgi:leader peptidase (prepilin peptidase) / N-methyltransferase
MPFFFIIVVAGFVAGRFSAVWAASLIEPTISNGLRICRSCNQPFSIVRQLLTMFVPVKCQSCQRRGCWWPVATSLLTGAAFGTLSWLLLQEGCQSVTEVRPSIALWQNRLPYQLVFVFLLTTVTVADLLDYIIPDGIIVPGILVAISLATFTGELQLIHVWVDWDYDFVKLYGPYLPEWMKHHQHLHGLVWSLCGLLTGAGLMWAARIGAHIILGMPAIGLGDVTLMAMIGAFMGWQPTLCVLAIAPLVGIILGLGGRIVTGRSFVAFGPYLCIAAYLVLCTWRLLWEGIQLRIIFSHWPTVAGMIAGSFFAFCVLLVGLRIFRAMPTERLR